MGDSIQPLRLTRSRAKGSKLVSPNGLPVVCVTRGTKWGNPFKPVCRDGRWEIVYVSMGHKFCIPKLSEHEARAGAIRLFRAYLDNDGSQPGSIRDMGGAFLKQLAPEELRGKNLACWCKQGQACHADVLLEIANAEGVSA